MDFATLAGAAAAVCTTVFSAADEVLDYLDQQAIFR